MQHTNFYCLVNLPYPVQRNHLVTSNRLLAKKWLFRDTLCLLVLLTNLAKKNRVSTISLNLPLRSSILGLWSIDRDNITTREHVTWQAQLHDVSMTTHAVRSQDLLRGSLRWTILSSMLEVGSGMSGLAGKWGQGQYQATGLQDNLWQRIVLWWQVGPHRAARVQSVVLLKRYWCNNNNS